MRTIICLTSSVMVLIFWLCWHTVNIFIDFPRMSLGIYSHRTAVTSLPVGNCSAGCQTVCWVKLSHLLSVPSSLPPDLKAQENAESLIPLQTARGSVEVSLCLGHMTQHIHLRRGVTACLKSADVTDLCQKVGVRGNRIKVELHEDKELQSRQWWVQMVQSEQD